MATDKGAAFLSFLKATATIRRKRVSSYGAADKVLWLANVPTERGECRSPFLTEKPEELAGLWLEVRKKRMPARPPAPQVVAEWVRADDLDQPEEEPELLPQITVLVERRVPDPDAPHDAKRAIVETVPEVRRLVDHREVEDAWLAGSQNSPGGGSEISSPQVDSVASAGRTRPALSLSLTGRGERAHF